MHTRIHSMLNAFASERFAGKAWDDLSNDQKNELRTYSCGFNAEMHSFEYAKPQAGVLWGNYSVKGAEEASSKVNHYIKEEIQGYSGFARNIGASVDLPARTVSTHCPVSELADWKLEMDKWVSTGSGKALKVAKEACVELNQGLVNRKTTDDTSNEALKALQSEVEGRVFLAVAAGAKASGSSAGVSQYLVNSARDARKQVESGDSTYATREAYLKASQKAQSLASHIDGIKADMTMEDYEKVLKTLFWLESAVSENLDNLTPVENRLKELIAIFPNNVEGINNAKRLASMCLQPMDDKVRNKLNTICEQSVNAYKQAEARASRKIQTPIPHILNKLATRHDVEVRNKTKTDPKSPDYSQQSQITRFDELSGEMKKSLLGKVAALYRKDDKSPAVYSSDGVGFGIKAVEGADTLAHSVQKRVGEAIDEMNTLAKTAGFEAEIEPLKETHRYLVSELVALDNSLATWARENPYLMDLKELEGGLSQLASRKSSDPDTAKVVHAAIDEHLNKVIITCVDGGGSAIDMLNNLRNKATAWKKDARNQAKPSCDYMIQKAGDLAESMRCLQEMQGSENALLPELSGKEFVAGIAALEPVAECSSDDVVKLDKLDKLYFEAAETLSESGIKFADIPSILVQYSSGARATAKARMQELSCCMTQSETVSDSPKKSFKAAREFASVFHSISSSHDPKNINYQKIDQAIADGIEACQKFEMNLAEVLKFLLDGLISAELPVKARILEYHDIMKAVDDGSETQCIDKTADMRNVVEAFDQLRSLKTVTGDSEEFNRPYSQALNLFTGFGIPVEKSASLICKHLGGALPEDVDGLIEDIADTLPVIPHPEQITAEYIGVVRNCSPHIKALKEAGKDIKQLNAAKQAIDGFVAALIESPGTVGLDQALTKLNQWFKEEAGSGTLFQASGSRFAKFTGFADSYEVKLKEVTERAKTLCREFDDKLEALGNEDNYDQFGLGKWLSSKKLSEELSEAFTHRAHVHINAGEVVFSQHASGNAATFEITKRVENAVEQSDEDYFSPEESEPEKGEGVKSLEVGASTSSPKEVPVPAPEAERVAPSPPPPPPPPPAGSVGRGVKKPDAKTTRAKAESSSTDKSSVGLGLAGFDPSKVKLKKTGTGSADDKKVEAKKNTAPRDLLLADIRKGGALKKVADTRKSAEKLPESRQKELDNKKRQAVKKELDRKLTELETKVEYLEGVVNRGTDDKRVSKDYKLKLQKAKQEINDFHKDHPGFKPGPLTEKQLAEVDKNKDVNIGDALKKRFSVFQLSDSGDEETSDSYSDSDGEWSDDVEK